MSDEEAERTPPVGWGAFCKDNDECKDGKHIHGDNAECVRYLRLDPKFSDIRDDQCCACYFNSFEWEEPIEDVEVNIKLK